MNNKPKITAEVPVHAPLVLHQMIDLFIRISGWSLLILLIVAYATGEEFQHTHKIIDYGIAALLAASIFWALIRPHNARFTGPIYSPSGIRALECDTRH